MGVSSTWIPRCAAAEGAPLHDLLIGFMLVVVASAGICVSLNLQKLVHMRNHDPVANAPRVHFTKLPLWWIAVVCNGVSELVNLAALGFAPATLVAPLGCLTVVFNSFTAVLWLHEPFLRSDLLGVLVIAIGTACVVGSQAGAPQAPITADYIKDQVLGGVSFWVYIGLLVGGMLAIRVFLEPRWATKYSWVYLGESALAGSFSTVAARAFASLLGPPMPGSWSNVSSPDALWVVWGSAAGLIITAGMSLVLQNKAMMHFGNSEVVPIYFALFSSGASRPSPSSSDTPICRTPPRRWRPRCRPRMCAPARARPPPPPLRPHPPSAERRRRARARRRRALLAVGDAAAARPRPVHARRLFHRLPARQARRRQAAAQGATRPPATLHPPPALLHPPPSTLCPRARIPIAPAGHVADRDARAQWSGAKWKTR